MRLKKNLCMSTFLSDSYQSFEDISNCLIDKTGPSDPHKKEYYWMKAQNHSTLWTQHQTY